MPLGSVVVPLAPRWQPAPTPSSRPPAPTRSPAPLPPSLTPLQNKKKKSSRNMLAEQPAERVLSKLFE